MYYFGYCTWLNDPELRRYIPDYTFVTKGYAANHKLRFHTAGERADRGWCHLDDTHTAYGHRTQGIVIEHDAKYYELDYDDFDRVFLTVHGDDGKTYDCWTYCLTNPGIEMRPPDFYWEHIPAGLKDLRFPMDYIAEVLAAYESAAPCPRADRPNPSAVPGRSADSR